MIQSVLHDEPRRNPSPAPSNSYRNGVAPGPPTVERERERTSSTRSRDAALRNRPPSIQVPSPAGVVVSPRQNRRPSNAASTISQVPSISSLAPQSRPGPVSNSVSRASQQIRDVRQAPDYPAKSRTASPAPSARTRQAPTRSDTIPPPQENGVPHRRDQNVRISYFDHTNQASLDRLLTNNTDSRIDLDGEEESARATLTNVEEMIEGYEWASDDVIGRKSTRGAIDLIEARLLDELTALEKVEYSRLEK